MFKQPRVPEYRENEGVSKHLKALTLFLKDFCQDAWVASGQAQKSIKGIRYPVTSVNQKTGDINLGAEEVGALAADGTAVNSEKLNDRTWAQTLLAMHPIGSIYLSVDAASPASLFGGAWEKLQDCFLLAAGSASAGSQGGGATHNHSLDAGYAKITTVGSNLYYGYSKSTGFSTGWKVSVNSPEANTSWVSDPTDLGGNTDNAEHLPPYLAVYMWKRVS